MSENPHCPIKLQKYEASKEEYKDREEENDSMRNLRRRINRVRVRQADNPPIDIWANWVVSSFFFKNLILSLIIVNVIVLGIQAEIGEVPGENLHLLKIVLALLDYCALFVFILEIGLKWIDDFWEFWVSGWNIFDFLVTLLSVLPDVIGMMRVLGNNPQVTGDFGSVGQYFRVFRIVRALKMVIHFKQMRLIALAITKAFRALLFITVLLFIFAYIFAIVGVMFFDKFSHSDTHDLEYREAFSSMLNALLTLWQIFTLDQWLKIYNDIQKVTVEKTTNWLWSAYIIFWILIGSFVFQNIFAGIMVNNFQIIRTELYQEAKKRIELEKAELNLEKLGVELHEYNRRQSKDKANINEEDQTKQDPTNSFLNEQRNKNIRRSRHSIERKSSSPELDIQEKIEKNLHNLILDNTMYCWPEDTFFRYLQAMESLQENLHERQTIIEMINQSLLNMLDNTALKPMKTKENLLSSLLKP
ncbi:DgyrCDS24 [Dimorphilus gyrociliatus]|uniref:DgyrCDS24 n=1 Tax=Dimorphilus gyrociliatus TaxID=2664684 RepID=A0A7I8V3N4_9ANNE|nr:DgyrCDS24 [Dimorphilus gyrociliatus]